MTNRKKVVEPIPDEFDSYEQAAEFWDTHDTTDYLDDFETVQYASSLQGRQFEIEIPEELVRTLRQKARQSGITVNELATILLRRQIAATR
ncbi:MAG: hypothetical protein HY741_03885 [Chloroflexi bacterium]|nr:hypothetical protein [Chloroflexota bacterium]